MERHRDGDPNERRILGRNPVQAKKSRPQRKARLEKTEKALKKIVQAVEREGRPLRGIEAISMRVGHALGRYKMKKPFTFQITDAPFSYTLKGASIPSAEALEGVYVIRPSLKEKPEASEVGAHYKRLSKAVSLQVRPISPAGRVAWSIRCFWARGRTRWRITGARSWPRCCWPKRTRRAKRRRVKRRWSRRSAPLRRKRRPVPRAPSTVTRR